MTNKAAATQTTQRLLKFPTAVAKCSVQARVYAKCVAESSENLKKNTCLKEFTEFNNCFQNALKKK